METFRPETPFAVLALMGEQGSVKSSTQNGIREIIDPNRVNLRAAPKTVEDLYVSASNGHLVSLENISHLSPPFKDALCVLARGGGFAGRTLFTNGDETVMELRRPIILNGIAAAVRARHDQIQAAIEAALTLDRPTVSLSAPMAESIVRAHHKAAQDADARRAHG